MRQNQNLSETVPRLLDKYKQLNCESLVCKNVNERLVEKVCKLEKAQTMSEQYSRINILNWQECRTQLETMI